MNSPEQWDVAATAAAGDPKAPAIALARQAEGARMAAAGSAPAIHPVRGLPLRAETHAMRTVNANVRATLLRDTKEAESVRARSAETAAAIRAERMSEMTEGESPGGTSLALDDHPGTPPQEADPGAPQQFTMAQVVEPTELKYDESLQLKVIRITLTDIMGSGWLKEYCPRTE